MTKIHNITKVNSDPSVASSALELVFLGTGNAFSMSGRYWGSILVNNHILLDASPVVVPHLKKLGRQLAEIEYIFITHFHADHYFGLPFLLLDYAYLTPMEHPLTIIGPKQIKKNLSNLVELGFEGLFEKLKDNLAINYIEVENRSEHSIDDLIFSAIPMSHGNAQAFGYKLRIANKTIGYTGDTDLCDGLIALANDLDILIIELSNPYDDVPGHMSLDKLKTLRKQTAPELKIILNHVGTIKKPLPKDEKLILPGDLEILRF
jgi:ribonuclease Z